MRNFEQRKAEIFRRSEQRIKKRKARNKVIACTMSLLICIAAASVLLLPSLSRQAQEDPANSFLYDSTDQSDDISSSSSASLDLDASLAQVESISGVFHRSFTEADEIQAVSQVLADIANSSVLSSDKSTNDLDDSYKSENFDCSFSPEGYKITLTYPNGAQKVYTLCDNILIYENTGESYYLSDDLLSALETALGL